MGFVPNAAATKRLGDLNLSPLIVNAAAWRADPRAATPLRLHGALRRCTAPQRVPLRGRRFRGNFQVVPSEGTFPFQTTNLGVRSSNLFGRAINRGTSRIVRLVPGFVSEQCPK